MYSSLNNYSYYAGSVSHCRVFNWGTNCSSYRLALSQDCGFFSRSCRNCSTKKSLGLGTRLAIVYMPTIYTACRREYSCSIHNTCTYIITVSPMNKLMMVRIMLRAHMKLRTQMKSSIPSMYVILHSG